MSVSSNPLPVPRNACAQFMESVNRNLTNLQSQRATVLNYKGVASMEDRANAMHRIIQRLEQLSAIVSANCVGLSSSDPCKKDVCREAGKIKDLIREAGEHENFFKEAIPHVLPREL